MLQYSLNQLTSSINFSAQTVHQKQKSPTSTLTHDVYRRGIDHSQEIFWVSPQKIGPKTTYSLKKNRVRRQLWTDLYEILTRDVYRSIVVHYEEIFRVLAPNRIWEPRVYLLSTTSPLNGKVDAQYFRRGTWWRQSGKSIETTGDPYIVPKFHERWSTNDEK